MMIIQFKGQKMHPYAIAMTEISWEMTLWVGMHQVAMYRCDSSHEAFCIGCHNVWSLTCLSLPGVPTTMWGVLSFKRAFCCCTGSPPKKFPTFTEGRYTLKRSNSWQICKERSAPVHNWRILNVDWSRPLLLIQTYAEDQGWRATLWQARSCKSSTRTLCVLRAQSCYWHRDLKV